MSDIAFRACLLGLPNVGKSLIFNVLSDMHKAESQNYPFCTIAPNKSIIQYKDERLYILQKEHKSIKVVPELVEFVDIAGLIQGASEGKGLGNEFLSNIYSTDCIIHVLRCFEDSEVLHEYDDLDPIRDLEIIRKELRLKDLDMIESYKRSKLFKDKIDLLNKIENALKKDEFIHIEDTSIHLLSLKPFIILCNGEENDNLYIEEVKKLCQKNNWICINFDFNVLKEDINTNKNAIYINKIISACRQSLKIISFFTSGPQEVHSWRTYIGTNIRQASGEIHTDFITKFIRAKVIEWGSKIEKTVDGSYLMQDGCQINVMIR